MPLRPRPIAPPFFIFLPMPRIISANLNGIRSAHKKGFFNWLAKQDADYICVQELKCQEADRAAGAAWLPRPLPLRGKEGLFGHRRV